MDACCAVPGNDCGAFPSGQPYCQDRASSSDWLFGLWPGPPQRFEPTGTDTHYQYVKADHWPKWGSGGGGQTNGGDLDISATHPDRARHI